MVDAEKEASEVLHSLLSVERIENRNITTNVSGTISVITGGSSHWHLPVNEDVQKARNDSYLTDVTTDSQVYELSFKIKAKIFENNFFFSVEPKRTGRR